MCGVAPPSVGREKLALALDELISLGEDDSLFGGLNIFYVKLIFSQILPYIAFGVPFKRTAVNCGCFSSHSSIVNPNEPQDCDMEIKYQNPTYHGLTKCRCMFVSPG